MRKTSILILLLTALLLKAGYVFSQNSINIEETETITGITVTGLKRTKQHIAENPLKKFIGMDVSSVHTDDVMAAVHGTGILEPLSVEITDDPAGNGSILHVTVSEKWSIFPIPMIRVSSGSFYGGAGVMDANAFGLNDKLVAGAMFGKQGWMGMGGYIHTQGNSNFPGWNVTAVYNNQERVYTDQNDGVYRRFGVNSITASLGLNYSFLDLISLSLGFGFFNEELKDIDNPRMVPAESGMGLRIRPGISIRKNDWDGFFLSQKSAGFTYGYIYGFDFPSYHSYNFRAAYEQSIIPGFRLLFHAGALYEPGVTPLFESSPSSVGINILPRDFSARHYAGASLGLEKSLLKFKFGLISLTAAYQVVYSDGPVLDEQLDHGFFSALRIYMSKVAMPALGLAYTYNAAADQHDVTFNIGMSF
ncbi:hypothetical protein [Breznakiella homolactica]|uniref:Bacterial surface antigen (D15) domain-containing protein n=1 Tax=Breznakiella homolactica TaxID=2798577 RepID=A0A7T7XMJ5_9SPIR|nr:hypothetical protein [Breznakiella homolactica]QQO08977.1 hypothetical protein JFL75_18905 [Breznakiella homolactica]